MSFHNLRDKFGKFRPATRREKAAKKPAKKTTSKRQVLKPVKKKHILNVFLLDNTGSMEEKVPATVAGFNKVIAEAEQTKKDTGIDTTETVILFGELGHFEIMDKVQPLSDGRASWPWRASSPVPNTHAYNPMRPRTAIWWSVKRAIEHATMQLEILPKDTKVLLTIFTDGENNDGHEYQSETKQLVEQKKAEGWVINFIGAGEENYIKSMSGKIGIFASNTLAYDNTSIGTATAMRKMSAARTAATMSYMDTGVVAADGFFSKD